MDTPQDNGNWERGVLEKLAFESLAEQRRNRRWKVILSLGWLSFMFLLLFVAMGWAGGKHEAGTLENTPR